MINQLLNDILHISMKKNTFFLVGVILFNLTINSKALCMDPLSEENKSLKSVSSQVPDEDNVNPPKKIKKKKKKKKTAVSFSPYAPEQFELVDTDGISNFYHTLFYEDVGRSWVRVNRDYDQENYQHFVSKRLKFDDADELPAGELAYYILVWSQYAGIPIVGLSRNQSFFSDNYHVLDPTADADILGDLEHHTDTGTTYYTDRVSVVFAGPHGREVSRPITQGIRDSVVYYHPDEVSGDRDVSIQRYLARVSSGSSISPRISFEFISDYLRDLRNFDAGYLREVMKGIQALPKIVVDALRGRAIYLTEEYGPSITIHTASNMRRIEYLGLIPGIFMERLRGGDHLLHTQVVHEIGHLFHQTVIFPNYVVSIGGDALPAMAIDHIDEFLSSFSAAFMDTFAGAEAHYDESQHKDSFQQKSAKWGFLTYYAHKNDSEDFAETFKYYLIHNGTFQRMMNARKLRASSKPRQDKQLVAKYEFLKAIIGEAGVAIDEDITEISEYEYRG